MRLQGLNGDGEILNSVYVIHDPVPAPAMDDGVTRQEFRDECDINIILARYEKTGVINHFNTGTPQYLDVTEFPTDLATALDVMHEAEAAFMRLPAVVRREFDNDPVAFAEFAQNPDNISKMREWGLAAPEKPAERVSAPAGSAVSREPQPEPPASPNGN